MSITLDEFLTRYAEHPVTEIEVPASGDPNKISPFIVLRHGERTMIVNPLGFEDHLSVDCHSFIGGQPATAGAFGMTEGRRTEFPATGTTSHGWSSSALVSVLLGKQKND